MPFLALIYGIILRAILGGFRFDVLVDCTLGKFLSFRFASYRADLLLGRETEQVDDARVIFCSVGAAG